MIRCFMEVGNIVYLKNICFGDGTADHACLVGRPCVYIGELDERMYFIPLVSIHKDKYKSESRIYPTKKNKLQKVSHPNVRVLIEKPIAFYVNERGYP